MPPSISLRPFLSKPPSLRALCVRAPFAAYHSSTHAPQTSPYRDPEAVILSNAITHISTKGFTQEALCAGAKDAGYLEISTNLFPKGPFELVLYHLITQRLALKDRVQFVDAKTSVGAKVRSLILERLRANSEHGVITRWQEALGLMSLLENIKPSMKELAALSDEIWFLAGDTSLDSSWYTKRASLSAIYAAAEVYQTTDQSTDFRDTELFLDRRLEELRITGNAVKNTTEWIGFQSAAMINLLRSKGMRI